MERKLVTLRKVKEIKPIENADFIEIAKIDGWQCVVKKGEFKTGDYGIYFEIDSLIPLMPWSEFLFKSESDRKKGVFRIKTIKLRGELSQGLLIPIENLFNKNLTEAMGVEKYEPPMPIDQQSKGRFPSFIQKTDEERCLSEDTVITTEDGDKTVKEICNTKYNGKVLSYNLLTDKKEWKEVISHSIMKNNNDWYEIELENGEISFFTGNELIYLPELMTYRRVDQLVGNEKIIFHKKNYLL